MIETYYITYDDGDCFFFSKGAEPIWTERGVWNLPGGSIAWIEAKLFEQLYPKIAKLLISDTDKNGIVEVCIENGQLTESEGSEVESCIKCGCTDEDCSQCIADQDEPCYWVSSGKCSRCFEDCGNPKKSEEARK